MNHDEQQEFHELADELGIAAMHRTLPQLRRARRVMQNVAAEWDANAAAERRERKIMAYDQSDAQIRARLALIVAGSPLVAAGIEALLREMRADNG